MTLKTLMAGTALAALAPLAALAEAGDCAALAGVAAHDTIVSEAVPMPADGALPAHCLVRGVIEPRVGTGGKQYGTGFELRLPEDWAGRFMMQGGGGWDGTVNPALGVIDRTKPEDTALGRGIAVASTDAGHYGDSAVDPWWAADIKARHDNGYNSAKLVTERSRDLIRRFYGELPHHSYFMGCSNGGRQGMVAAVRYPEYFDGVLAAAPAFDLTPSVVAWNWNTRALKELADAETGGDIAATFSDEDLALISTAAVDACDMEDGSDDNLVMAPFQCRLDVSTLQCPAEGGDQCLSAGQVTALSKIQDGPSDSAGTKIYEGWSLAGIEGPSGFRLWTIGGRPGPNPTSLGGMFQEGWLRNIAVTPPDQSRDAWAFRPDDMAAMDSADIFSAASTDYAAFADKGGKLLIWHGTADGAFSLHHLAAWFDKLKADNDGAEFARLYFTPSVHHCAGGPGLTSFDSLSPLIDWVENGTVPGPIPATGTPPGADGPVTRPLCAYPAHATPDGNGGFTCSAG
ncbi:tannase/feruloyl esterase family alpha/beta hydrolase [Mesobacterium pallidum]|uniref:tannase/feruloyl esterase family alpha/beta hydrolase n=1 Tax=Mesobacterium pallidum TaxID=2872037 RepID=UPI001EE22950|nr:tannase/feruloyl esterase family alpha/beta hydrolase [Mesobacterium pallidum]